MTFVRCAPSEGVINLIVGKRYVDAPIRALALLDVIAGFSADTMESTELIYLVLHFSARFLVLGATFAPISCGLLSGALFFVNLLLYPEFLDQFQAPLLFSAAVLLTKMQWIEFLALTLITFVLTWVATKLGAPAGYALTFEMLTYESIRNSFLAVTAAGVEARLKRELLFRETSIREHEQKVQSERLRFALDAHDTISAGLARQGSIITLISSTQVPAETDPPLAELAIAHEDTQQELRGFISRMKALGQISSDTCGFNPSEQSDLLRESLLRAADVGHLELAISFEAPLEECTQIIFEEFKFILRELVTNMVKHATPHRQGSLAIGYNEATCAYIIQASNSARGKSSSVSQSVVLRAERLGGSAVALTVKEIYAVTVVVPGPNSQNSGSRFSRRAAALGV